MRSRWPYYASGSNYRRYSPINLPRRSQCTNSPNTNGPIALPLQNKGGLPQSVFMAGRLSGYLHAVRRHSPHSSMSWSHPLSQGLRQPARHDSRPQMHKLRRGATDRKPLTAEVSKCCSTEAATLRQIIPMALGSYH